jgi:hypothetical protein
MYTNFTINKLPPGFDTLFYMYRTSPQGKYILLSTSPIYSQLAWVPKAVVRVAKWRVLEGECSLLQGGGGGSGGSPPENV